VAQGEGPEFKPQNYKKQKHHRSQMQWYRPVIPAIQKVEVGELQSNAGPGKNRRPYLKNKLKAKGLGLLA
jgi:hypothetical protein